MSICERIFSVLEIKGISQKELASAIGVSPKTINTWKSRNTDPDAKYISSIADFLKCSISYILTGEGSADVEETKELDSLYDALDRSGRVQLLAKAYELSDTQKNEKAEESESTPCSGVVSGCSILGERQGVTRSV